MADAVFTREALALSMFNTVRAAEKDQPSDRAYTLDLLAEIIDTIDGKRGAGAKAAPRGAAREPVRRRD